jgi:hypothetical protein
MAAVRRHVVLLAEHMADEERACRDIRKHVAWYLKGYPVGHGARVRLGQVSSLAELDTIIPALPLHAGYPGEAAEGQRGRAGSPRPVALPEGWLASRSLDGAAAAAVAQAEAAVSGG